ncbi:hypothetical protein [Longispora albida]|uniref:hypothetical protein n=1 Tax=Longispora albida TaxID=203523 RepID=UPI00039BA0FF|nr:hypothetical protein [Longispora albida]
MTPAPRESRTVLESGRVLRGRYQLSRLAGRGATASVWQGTDLRSGRTVAVKVLHRAGGFDAAARLGLHTTSRAQERHEAESTMEC